MSGLFKIFIGLLPISNVIGSPVYWNIWLASEAPVSWIAALIASVVQLQYAVPSLCLFVSI